MSIRNIIITAAVFGVIGLVIGYFVFAHYTVPIVGTQFLSPLEVIKGNAPSGVLRNILLSGAGGAIIGAALAFLGLRKR